MTIDGASLPVALDVTHLRPFAKGVILEYTGGEALAEAAAKLAASIQGMYRNTANRKATLVAEGFGEVVVRLPPLRVTPDTRPEPNPQELDDGFDVEESVVNAFVMAVERRPGWATEAAPFSESSFELIIMAWWRKLVAVHADGTLVDKIQKWLDGRRPPPYRRIPQGVLNATLLAGEAKSLWLRGAHPRRTTKADTKTVAGSRLQDALNPFEDSTFAMASARAEMVPIHPELSALTGVVGTTPRKSLVWMSQSADLAEYGERMRDLLRALQRALSAGISVDRPYELLSVQVPDLTGVGGAYELFVTDPNQLEPGASDSETDAATLLSDATLRIDDVRAGPSFEVAVGLDGSTGGHLQCVPVMDRGRVQLRFGYLGQPTDPDSVRSVLEALQKHQDLLTVHYDSGHAVHSGSVWSSHVRPAAFTNWSWHDFSGYNIGQEKPCDGSAREIHDAIGRATDHSLFNWVAQVYACHGWLTCDDGSGEIADFVYVRPDGTLELIHVKAAESSHTRRGVSAAAYEVVASQATKNLQYLDPQRLIGHLERPLTFAPASWTHGGRVGTRDEVIEALLARGASDPIQVTVVQPHLRRSKRESSLAHHQGSNADSSRLRLLETLLNSARASATGMGADLVVVADDN